MNYTYKATVLRVVDGDTLDLDFDLGLRTHCHTRVRLLGVNTPETYGVRKDSEEYSEGMRAKEIVSDWLSQYEFVVVETKKDKVGKYGRWLATISPPDGGESLNEMLVGNGWSY